MSAVEQLSTEFRGDRSILVVDDENGVRDLMSRWLQASGYDVVSAAGADEALDRMERSPSAVALCDIRMPGHDGLWLADRLREQYPETAVIMATGVHDLGTAAASFRHGVVDYLTKPFGRERLSAAVVRGIEWHRSARESRSWRDRLEGELAERRARLAGALEGAAIDSDEALEGTLASLHDGRDRDGGAHRQRVAALAVSLAQALGLGEQDVTAIRRAALLHDIGLLAMPEALLEKPAPLTPDERALIRRHPLIGYELLAAAPHLADAAAIVRTACERPDGLGYPAGLSAGDLPIGARIVAAADAYDTMLRPRVFRDALTAGDALLELDRCCGTQFDAHVVRVLKALIAVH